MKRNGITKLLAINRGDILYPNSKIYQVLSGVDTNGVDHDGCSYDDYLLRIDLPTGRTVESDVYNEKTKKWEKFNSDGLEEETYRLAWRLYSVYSGFARYSIYEVRRFDPMDREYWQLIRFRYTDR